MKSVNNRILARIRRLGRGSVLTTIDFIDIANRANLDVALSTLVANGVLRRLSQGIYDYPIQHPKLGTLAPDIDKVIDAVKRRTGDKLQVNGATAANLLGLSTQVPAKIVYYTDGYGRVIKVGNWKIQFKHAGPKILAGAGQMAGVALQAIRYLGKQNAGKTVINKMATILSPKDKRQLKKMIYAAPSWAHNPLQEITK